MLKNIMFKCITHGTPSPRSAEEKVGMRSPARHNDLDDGA
jgi:hypothetical protein